MRRNRLQSPEDNRRMFDGIAPRYDLLNRMLSLGMDRGWRRRAVSFVGPTAGGRYLDIGTGTGDLCIELCRQGPGCVVTGIDPAPGMLALGKRKIKEAGLEDDVSFEVADGSALPFADGTFSGIVSAFTIRNITDRDLAMREMFRVLRPGGKVAILELTRPADRFMRVIHRLYNRSVVPVVGRLLSRGEAYDYLIRSIEDFPSPTTVAEGLAASGFTGVEVVPCSGGVVTLFTGIRRAEHA